MFSSAGKSRSRGKEKSAETLNALTTLQKFYKPFNDIFFKQIGREILHWNDPVT